MNQATPDKKQKNILFRFLETILWRPFPKKVQAVLCAVIPMAVFYLQEILTHNPIEDIHIGLHIYNWILYVLIYTVFFFVIGSMRWAYFLPTILLAIVGLSNMFTLELRGAPILPWDIRSAGTAASVLDNMSLELAPETIHILWGFGLILFLSLHCDLRAPAWKKRMKAGLASAAILAAMCFGVQTQWLMDTIDIYEMPFTQGYTYRQNGFLVSFLMNAKYLGIDKPEGYDVKELEETIDETLEDALLEENGDVPEAAPDSGELPNIIVIMNEAFSDLSVLGDLQTNKDYMPYFRSLTENTISGNLYVSVLGGNTANSEFEFLTGDSMAFLPTGSIPSQQYIKKEIPTLVNVLNDQGYYSIAMHPYYASGWERDKVYDWMGFDEKYFLNDFSGAQRLRQYVSDWGMYRKLISTYQNLQDTDQPLFYFGVTMQNHSGYSKEYDNFSNDIHVISNSGKEYRYADTYLSLIAESDRAFEKLINYFRNIDDPTIILMFGDHQPHSMETAFFKELLGTHPLELNLEQTTLRHQTPFKLWANYDIEEQTDINISLNYLSTLLMKSAGLELSEYQDYLWQTYQELPVVTANFYMDNDGNVYDYQSEDSLPEYEDLLDDYSSVQYNHLFDETKRLESVFELPDDVNS